MLFSRDWLSDYVDLPADPAAVARGLTAVGLAVEGTEESGDDVIFDVDVTTNRPDAMCHLGLAREAAVHFASPLRPPEAAPTETDERADAAVTVTIEDPEGCRRYVARVVRGVTVGPSPEWLARRLHAIGLRPINNVVDVTNYVLWETGQPLHAFDLAKVAAASIVVRRARQGERLTTLDEVDRELSPEVLVIADAERPVALAGIMGGRDSEVTSATRDLLLESAHFDRRRVRLGARQLAMHTDASHRFERGADPGACRLAADRAAALLAELAGGSVLAGAVDARGAETPSPVGRLDHARLEAFAGTTIDPADVERWLGGLGFLLEAEGGASGGSAPSWRVTVPSWRRYDVPGDAPDGGVYEADLFEEVLRHHGFDRIAPTLPAIRGSDGPPSSERRRRDRIRDHLAACGWAEAIDYAFHSSVADAALPSAAPAGAPAVAIANPLSERYAVLRRSLLPNLLEAARFNLRRGASAVRLFEVGHVFWRTADGGADERETVALVAGGHVGRPWDRHVELDFFDLKGVVESLAEALGSALEAHPADDLPGLTPGAAATLAVAGEPIGVLGRVDDPDEPIGLWVAELVTGALGTGVGARAASAITGSGTLAASSATASGSGSVKVPSRHPAVAADLTLVHPLSVPWGDIAAAIEEERPADLAHFGLEVRYDGEGVPEGAVATTIGFLYAAPDRSLTQEEVNQQQETLRRRLADRFGHRQGEEGG
ncbi:MAG TPA: phenylalanine--tRNA ligase subunit beta [Thermoanaerobaculia bacterium]|nr:phenylalanine--tRNA ligase subunit beta [Thermoanaerobaculia bacterium]